MSIATNAAFANSCHVQCMNLHVKLLLLLNPTWFQKCGKKIIEEENLSLHQNYRNQLTAKCQSRSSDEMSSFMLQLSEQLNCNKAIGTLRNGVSTS